MEVLRDPSGYNVRHVGKISYGYVQQLLADGSRSIGKGYLRVLSLVIPGQPPASSWRFLFGVHARYREWR